MSRITNIHFLFPNIRAHFFTTGTGDVSCHEPTTGSRRKQRYANRDSQPQHQPYLSHIVSTPYKIRAWNKMDAFEGVKHLMPTKIGSLCRPNAKAQIICLLSTGADPREDDNSTLTCLVRSGGWKCG